ncbi:LysR substrate-binding domain-containing protein [Eionea flava]
MKKTLPPLNWLRSFDAAARHLNFTTAGKELNLTQAAISQQVKGLESQLGVVLFQRLPRGLKLTEAGQAYMPVVHESIQKLAAATEEMFGGGYQSKVLTIKTNLVFFTTWIAPRLHNFTQRYPDIKLRFSSNIWVQYNDTLSDPDADMEIRYGQGNWEGMESQRLTWDQLVPVCHPRAVNGLAPPSSLEQLDDYTLLHVMGYEEGWGFFLQKSDCNHVSSASGIQFDTLISALEMAKLGQGIALGRSTLVQGCIDDKTLTNPFDISLPIDEAFYLCLPAERYRHPNVDVFSQWIIEEVGVKL